jgi:hypothetical protein
MEATTMVDWMLDTEDRLREMLDHGLLTERHTVEFKAKLDQGRGANKEHARDLAQSGPDGGVLVVGVDDGQLTPMELAGQHERIDQIARSSRYTCASRRSPPQASPQGLSAGGRPARPATPGISAPALIHPNPARRRVPLVLERRLPCGERGEPLQAGEAGPIA